MQDPFPAQGTNISSGLRRHSRSKDFRRYLRRLLCGLTKVEKRNANYKAHDEGARPESLPTQRRRALTLPSSSSAATESSTQNPISQQKKSPFFNKLPLEIRRLIYQEVLAPSRYPTLHVANGDGRLLSRRCAEDDAQHPSWCHGCWGNTTRDGTILYDYGNMVYEPVYESVYPYPVRIQILRSCRRIYSESIDLLYSQNVLSFRQSQTIVDLQRTILPQHFDRIRSLKLSIPFQDNEINPLRVKYSLFPGLPKSLWWTAWETIADMKSLLNLQVEFTRFRDYPFENQGYGVYPDWNDVIEFLEPMKAIRVPNFVLTLFWPLDQAKVLRAVGDAAPFRVEFEEHHGTYWS